jgi:hypothetical protein
LTKGVEHAKGISEDGIKNTESLEEVTIPLERIATPVLLQGAKQDTMWPSHEMSLAIMERVNNKNPSHKFKLLSYDLDHFLTKNKEPVVDALKFVTTAFHNNPKCLMKERI